MILQLPDLTFQNLLLNTCRMISNTDFRMILLFDVNSNYVWIDAAKLCVAPELRSFPNHSTYLSPPLSYNASPKLWLSKFLLRPPDTLTRNGLRCFPAPVNRLPACEGIDGFDIGCCLTQKRRHGPRDGPFLTLHIHHVGQSNEWDTGLPPGRGWEKRREEM